MDDMVSKQVVIDTVRTIILGFFSDEDGAMTDTEKTLLSVNKAICNGVRELPSAQPIIRCKECKYYNDSDGCFFSTAETIEDGFCNWAERKG